MRGDEYRQRLADAMLEAELQAHVIDAVSRLGGLVYHTHDSRRSESGFPDLVIVLGGRVLYRELKRQSQRLGQVTERQQAWLHSLAMAGQDVDVWRPLDWLDGTVSRTLAGLRQGTP